MTNNLLALRKGKSLNISSVRTPRSPCLQRRRCLSVNAAAVSDKKLTVAPTGTKLTPKMKAAISEFAALQDNKDKLRTLLAYARRTPPIPASKKIPENRAIGCTAQVWLTAELAQDGTLIFSADSDSEMVRGAGAVLVGALSGLTPDQYLKLDNSFVDMLNLGSLSHMPGLARAVGALNMFETLKIRTRALLGELPRFPSLLIKADSVEAQGAFAEAQAQYMSPDKSQVAELANLLSSKKIGIVAHFYMDPQVQGVLASAGESWPHVAISDSLLMADTAVQMAAAGCTTIVVLGVDFMSENVRAILDSAGYTDVKVYRMSSEHIGCSLAEAAESASYERYLAEAASTPNSLHVVYINTSLKSKALAHTLVPTISCTSSNVVQTILQAFAQVPDATVWYGPDTYMGRNLATLFTTLSQSRDEDVKKLHPLHTAATVKALLPRLRYYEDGTCIVHHIFGEEVCDVLAKSYGDAYLTAHFEVPGEMFTMAMAANARGRGVVGSTSNILDYIKARLKEVVECTFSENAYSDRLVFVLGTEAGMITSIVRAVQEMLVESCRKDVEVEIVFPVTPQAITTDRQTTSSGKPIELPTGISMIPGPASGEGCSLEGGCAACPYMKMNSLAALLKVARSIGNPVAESLLEGYRPRPYSEKIGGMTVAQAGCVPILHMRHFQTKKELSEGLVKDIRTRNVQ